MRPTFPDWSTAGLFGPRLARFATVGVAAALILFLLSFVLTHLGVPPFAAGAAAYAAAFAFAYTLQHGWTFGGGQPHRRALPRYLIVQCGCALLSGAVSHLALGGLGLAPWAASGLTTIVASAASFVLSSCWAFARGQTNLTEN